MQLLNNCIHSKLSQAKNGFTLIEILISVGILGVIFGASLFASLDLYRSYLFISQRNTLITMLEKARAQSQNGINGNAHGVEITPSNFILFSGESYGTRDTSLDVIFPVDDVIEKSGSSEVVFSAIDANVDAMHEIVLSDSKNSINFRINSEGGIDW